jgi:ClpP class serine protease
MNYSLAREIYGLNPWCVDAISMPSLTAILKNMQNGVSLEIPEQKYNSVSLLKIENKTRTISQNWQLDNNDEFEAIGVINLDGPITKGGGASSYGTKDLSKMMLQMSKDDRVKGFVLNVDSGGGSSAAVQLMVDTINDVKQTKPVYAVVSKGGMAGSAAYGIASAANKIYSEDEMNIVGSVGTMISFEGRPANSTAPDGTKHIVLYATKSTEKNKAFEEALNNDNYKLLINDLLDPMNENFIKMVGSNRPQLKETSFDNGHTLFSKDAIGTFIDGIASFDQVVEMVMNESKVITNNNNSSLTNSQKKMTKEELKQSHPEVHASIVAEGANAERERVASWMVYAETDIATVTQGIESGAEITASQREKLMVKMNSKGMLEALKADNPTEVIPAESPIEADPKKEPESNENPYLKFVK